MAGEHRPRREASGTAFETLLSIRGPVTAEQFFERSGTCAARFAGGVRRGGGMSSAALFDSLAARYDELWTTTAVGRAQRNAVWRAVDGLFRTGDRLLDIGCGTGEDARHFAARGITVHAADASRAMVAQAAARGGFSTQVLAAEQIGMLWPSQFDGAISNFGALNCVTDAAMVARSLGRLVKPGGAVAVCIIGRFCL